MLRVDFGLVFTVVNLLVLYYLIRRFLLGPIHKILDQRQAAVDQAMDEAEETKQKAQALEQQRSEALKATDREREQILTEARHKATEEYQRILEDANNEAERVVREAHDEADLERQEILRRTQSELAEMVLSAAAKVSASSESDQALYDIFLEKAGKADGQSGN